ncbi:MAG: hypothetical protein RIR70_1855 [Pseudomonadota bacterium]|jgi:tRNA threonylcarbamoyl adenosine modification protein (Sua5/YciO/YrdC/YwlC family)
MTQLFHIHPDHPQLRLIRQAAQIIQGGGLIALPTDAAYSLAGHINDADLISRIRRLRGVDERHQFTLMCRDLSELANYARVNNTVFRLLKALTPGPYTFVLEGTRELPRRVLHHKRKTIGLRIPDHPVVQALLAEMNEPILCSTLIPAGEEYPLPDAETIEARFGKQLDLIIDSGACGLEVTTAIDLTADEPLVLREGKGAVSALGL